MDNTNSLNKPINRRNFLSMGITGMGLFVASRSLGSQHLLAQANPESAAFHSLESIGKLLPADKNGIMLPAGFKSRIVARSGDMPFVGSNYIWHPAPDGGATFATEDGGWIYVSNSEIVEHQGGAGALRFNAKGEIVNAYRILDNTMNNCAGGATPWGTWLSCEEVPNGQVYECDPFGIKPAKVRPALGRFTHEAVTVDALNQCLYLTEDTPTGGLYRFRPTNGLPDLSEGQLEIASVTKKDGKSFISWHQVPDPQAKTVATNNQVAGYKKFAGGEGIAIHQHMVYFTTKHDTRVWSYNTKSQQLDIIYDINTSANPILRGVDNITITPTGDVMVAEEFKEMKLIVLSPNNKTIPFLQVIGQDLSELTGPAFDPTFERLYFSSQRGFLGEPSGGITYEISVDRDSSTHHGI